MGTDHVGALEVVDLLLLAVLEGGDAVGVTARGGGGCTAGFSAPFPIPNPRGAKTTRGCRGAFETATSRAPTATCTYSYWATPGSGHRLTRTWTRAECAGVREGCVGIARRESGGGVRVSMNEGVCSQAERIGTSSHHLTDHHKALC